MELLETRKLSKDFGGLLAIAHLNFHVDEGEIVSVIGPNGAGKTTFFNLITGMYPPLSGEIVFDGHNLVGLKPDKITRLGIARTFQTVRLFNNMTILENAMVAQHTRSKSGIVSAILHLPSFKKEEARIRKNAKDALSFFSDLDHFNIFILHGFYYCDRTAL